MQRSAKYPCDKIKELMRYIWISRHWESCVKQKIRTVGNTWIGGYRIWISQGLSWSINPTNNADIIYTPDVTVFKTDTNTPRLMDEKDWYDVDVITCAAPNLREKPSNRFNQGNSDRAVKVSDRELLEIHKKRLTRILDVAVLNGDEVVILGAFGCGAFQNKPEVVARAAKEAMADYLHAFKTIEFAVYCPPRDDTNFKVFKRVMGAYNKSIL